MQINERVIKMAWEKVIRERSSSLAPVAREEVVHGYVLGGQPGAGKSHLISMVMRQLRGNVVVINGDDFRKYHAEYGRLQREYSGESSDYTKEFAATLTEIILKRALEERYNIVIEGTFRTHETPMGTLRQMQEKGYATHVMIQSCPKEVSWDSCQERYQKAQRYTPEEARAVPVEHHDLVVKNLATNIKRVWESGASQTLEVFWRSADGSRMSLVALQEGEVLTEDALVLLGR